MEKQTLASVMQDLAARGFTEQFKAMPGGLLAVRSGQTFAPSEVTIREDYRFEGESDLDDMSIVYAIETCIRGSGGPNSGTVGKGRQFRERT